MPNNDPFFENSPLSTDILKLGKQLELAKDIKQGWKAEPFPLLDLPVDCVANVIAYIYNLEARSFLYNVCGPELRSVFANPRSYRERLKLWLSDDPKSTNLEPVVTLRYVNCQMPLRNGSRDDVLTVLQMANHCPKQLQATLNLGYATRLLVGILLDHLKEHEGSFVGSHVTMNLPINEREQLPVSCKKVTQLLNEYRARNCRVTLVLLIEPKLKLAKKDNQLGDIRLFIGEYPFYGVRIVTQSESIAKIVGVPACIDPANASTTLLDSLREIQILKKPIRSALLNQILYKCTRLQKIQCSVICEADSSAAALAFHTNVTRLHVHLAKRKGDRTKKITAEECDYGRRLLNRCPNVRHAIFVVPAGVEYTASFVQTLLYTFGSTRSTRCAQLDLGFLVRMKDSSQVRSPPLGAAHTSVPAQIRRRIEQRPELDERLRRPAPNEQIDYYVSGTDAEDDFESLLPSAIVDALCYLDAHVHGVQLVNNPCHRDIYNFHLGIRQLPELRSFVLMLS